MSIDLFAASSRAQSPKASSGLWCEPDENGKFVLRVHLSDPFNPNRDFRLPVQLNQPFLLRRMDGNVKNTISGKLNPCRGGKYPLRLSISEWVSEKHNVSGTTDHLLQPGKADGSGFISSVVYSRIVTLERLGDPPANLLSRFRNEADVAAKENLLTSITTGYPDAGAVLLQMAKDPNTADTRWLAIRGIGYLKYEPAAPFLVHLLNSSNSYVRANSARALGDMKVTVAGQPLVKILVHENNGGVVEQIALALEELECKSALPVLERKAQEPLPSQTKGWLLGAIGRLGSRADVPFLSKFLYDRDVFVAYAAAGAVHSLTKEDFGFSRRPGPTDLSAPVKRAQQWWEEHKHEWP